MTETLKNKTGFTIIEVVMASLILLMSLIGGAVCFSANRKNLVYANLQRLATWSAIYKIEQLKSADYTSLTGGTENLIISGEPFQRRTTIQNIGAGPDYKQVTVDLDWGSGSFPLSLTSVYFRPVTIMRRGFTLIELIIAIVISFIALFGIEALIAASFRDWKTTKEAVDLERDIDLAGYRIKGVLEEANADTILSGGTKLVAGYNGVWLKEFYGAAGNALIFKDDISGSTETIINTLQSITFANGSDNRSVRVNLTVARGTRQIDSSFLVYLRNKGSG